MRVGPICSNPHFVANLETFATDASRHGALGQRAGQRRRTFAAAAAEGTVQTVYADGGYQGKLLDWAQETLGMHLSIIKRTLPKGFQVLPKRWVVERTLAWLGWNRRLSKD